MKEKAIRKEKEKILKEKEKTVKEKGKEKAKEKVAKVKEKEREINEMDDPFLLPAKEKARTKPRQRLLGSFARQMELESVSST